MKNLKSIFMAESINTGRQPEVDIAKGLAAISMILCHTCMEFGDFTGPFQRYVLSRILGGPFSAPVFMFCMGIGLCYTKKNKPEDYTKRGVSLLWYSLLFGLARDVLPVLLTWKLSGNAEVLEYLPLFFCTDILRFAGLYFLVFAFLTKRGARPRTLAILAVAGSCAGQLLCGVSTGSEILDIPAGFVWHTGDLALFPFLNWFLFPTAGYLFARKWKHCRDKAAFYRLAFPVCGAFSLIYFLGLVKFGESFLSGGNFYGVGILDACCFLPIVVFVLGLGYYSQFLPKILSETLARMGRNSYAIYYLHWLLLYAVSLPYWYLMDPVPFSDGQVVAAALLIAAASDFIARCFLRWRRKAGAA